MRDFGVGLVCVGGDQTYAAGGYRGTPLESTLPVNMELDSKKVLPSGAVVLIMHGMEFNNGNEIARECAQGVLSALGPTDEMGVLLWDGNEHWVFPLQKVGNKVALRRQIAGMNQGDLGSFQHIMEMAHEALQKSSSNLKHIIVFSDGDPGPPDQPLMQAIVNDRITVSTVLISGHAGPETMASIAMRGRGQFYDVKSPNQLPQIFVKEAAVVRKSLIRSDDKGIPLSLAVPGPTLKEFGRNFPDVKAFVVTAPKDRAEMQLYTTVEGEKLPILMS